MSGSQPNDDRDSQRDREVIRDWEAGRPPRDVEALAEDYPEFARLERDERAEKLEAKAEQDQAEREGECGTQPEPPREYTTIVATEQHASELTRQIQARVAGINEEAELARPHAERARQLYAQAENSRGQERFELFDEAYLAEVDRDHHQQAVDETREELERLSAERQRAEQAAQTLREAAQVVQWRGAGRAIS